MVFAEVIFPRPSARRCAGIERTGVDPVADGIAAGGWRCHFQGVDDLAGYDIIMAAQLLQVAPRICVDGIKVTEYKYQAARPGDPAQTHQCIIQVAAVAVCACSVGRIGGGNQLADQSQYATLTSQWPQFMVSAVE